MASALGEPRIALAEHSTYSEESLGNQIAVSSRITQELTQCRFQNLHADWAQLCLLVSAHKSMVHTDKGCVQLEGQQKRHWRQGTALSTHIHSRGRQLCLLCGPH